MGEILERPLAPARHRLSVDAYYRMAEAGILADPHHVELIDGEIFDMAAIGSPHAAITNRLGRLFARAVADGVALVSVQNPFASTLIASPSRMSCFSGRAPTAIERATRGGRRSPPRRSLGKLPAVRPQRQAPALREIRRSRGLDRRSCWDRGRSLSRTSRWRLCVTRAADHGIARPGARSGGDGRCRWAARVNDRRSASSACVRSLCAGLLRQGIETDSR